MSERTRRTAQTIGLGQARVLCQMPHEERLAFIAKGLALILASARSYWEAARQLEAHPREAEVLCGLAVEEAAKVDEQLRADESGTFDIDTVVDDALTMPERPESPVTMEDLDRVIAAPDLMPNGIQIRRLRAREYGLRAPGMSDAIRVTTNPEYYEAHSQSLELWSPGNPLFLSPEMLAAHERDDAATLHEILTRYEARP